MSCVITIRPSLNTIKIFKNVNNAEAFYNSLMINRAIPSNDLDIYSINCGTHDLETKEIFSFVDANTIELKVSKIEHSLVVESKPWNEIPYVTCKNMYTEAEMADIDFNIQQPDDTTWRAVPNKDIQVPVETIVEEVVQTISVTKLNPFS